MSGIENKGFWDKRQSELDSAARTSAQFGATQTSRKHDLERQIDAAKSLYQDTAAMESELAEIQAQEDAERDGEWTMEATQARRSEWNARVKAGEFNDKGKISPLKVRNAERTQGWYTQDLVAAIKRLGL